MTAKQGPRDPLELNPTIQMKEDDRRDYRWTLLLTDLSANGGPMTAAQWVAYTVNKSRRESPTAVY